jgi:hypothetical protein
VQLFLACAESRYLSYLQLLEFHYQNGQHQGRSPPLPPWYALLHCFKPLAEFRDVAIIFHAHFLSPFRFYADMSCRDPRPILLNSKISFPLERMHHLITHNIWSEPDSRQQWIEAFPGTPYQLWDNDPFSTDAPLKVQNIEMVCPFCNKTIILELATFTLMHTRKNFRCSCPKCNVQFDADRLSAENLRQDLLKVLKSENKNWYRLATALKSDLPCRFVKGVQFEVDGTERVTSDIDNDFNLILHENEIHSPRGVKIANQGTALARYVTLHPARTNDIPSWKSFFWRFKIL